MFTMDGYQDLASVADTLRHNHLECGCGNSEEMQYVVAHVLAEVFKRSGNGKNREVELWTACAGMVGAAEAQEWL